MVPMAKQVVSSMEKRIIEKREVSVAAKAPYQVFRYPWTWSWYECFRWYPLWGFIFTGVTCIWLAFRVESDAMLFWCVFVGYMMLYSAFISPLLVSVWKLFRFRRHNASMASLISELQPGLSKAEWDNVVCALNAQFYRDGVWHTPYALYSGEACRILFRRLIMKPFYDKTFSDEEKDGLRQCASEYDAAVQELFDQYCEDPPLEISAEYVELPRDLYRNKLSFNRRFFKTWYFFFPTAYVAYVLLCYSNSLPFSLVTFFILDLALLLFLAVTTFKNFTLRKFTKLHVVERTKILAEIMVAKPQNEDDWSVLAKQANQRLHEQKIWTASHELFYDGREYKDFYGRVMDNFDVICELAPLVEKVKAKLAGGDLNF